MSPWMVSSFPSAGAGTISASSGAGVGAVGRQVVSVACCAASGRGSFVRSGFVRQVGVQTRSRRCTYGSRVQTATLQGESGSARATSVLTRHVGLLSDPGNSADDDPVATRIVQPWGYSSAPGHCPSSYLYPYPSPIRVGTGGGDGRGHASGEGSRFRGEATPLTSSYAWPLAPTVASRADRDLFARGWRRKRGRQAASSRLVRTPDKARAAPKRVRPSAACGSCAQMARSTFPALRQEVQTFTRLGAPLTMARTR